MIRKMKETKEGTKTGRFDQNEDTQEKSKKEKDRPSTYGFANRRVSTMQICTCETIFFIGKENRDL